MSDEILSLPAFQSVLVEFYRNVFFVVRRGAIYSGRKEYCRIRCRNFKAKGMGNRKSKKHQDWNGKYCLHRTLDMGWERFLNMIRGFLNQDTVLETPEEIGRTKDLGNVDCIYQAYTDQWQPPVKNCEDWAGAGDNEAIQYLGICVSKGCIRGRVYTEKNGWLPYITFRSEYDIADTENGVLGDGSPIQAVQLYYITPNGYAYKKAVYCVSDMNHEIFYPIQNDDEMDAVQDGYAGVKGVAVDKFQAWIEQSVKKFI